MASLPRMYGKFLVTVPLIENNPEEIGNTFRGVIIIRAEYMFHNNTIEYIGWSPHFRELERGQITPEYSAECTRHEEGHTTVKWVEQK